MESPNSSAKTASGTQSVMAPVAGLENSALVKCPSCQTNVSTPNAAASEIRFSSRALTGSHTDRSARVSKIMVTTTMAAAMMIRFRPYSAVMKSASWAGDPPTRAPGTRAAAARIWLSAALPALVEGSARDQASATRRPSRDQAAGAAAVICLLGRARKRAQPRARAAGSRWGAGHRGRCQTR